MSDSVTITKTPKVAAKERLQKAMSEESRIVKGVFKNYECAGGSAKISVRKFPGQPIETHTFMDGQEYEIPLWLARHLNGMDACAPALNGRIHSCGTIVHQYHIDPKSGQSSLEVGQVRRRYGFQSLDFLAV